MWAINYPGYVGGLAPQCPLHVNLDLNFVAVANEALKI